MTKVFVDADLLTKLQNVKIPLELCDESGKVLGRVFPTPDASEYQAWEPTFGEADLRKAEQSAKWRTTAEVLSRLEKA